MGYIKELFSSKGRWNRSKFWLYPLPFILLLMLMLIFIISFDIINDNEILFLTLLTPIYVALYYITFTSYIKRLHDLNKIGWRSLFIFIPFANIYLFIICGFFKGTTGKNQYGPDPLNGTDSNNNIHNEL